MDAYQNFKYANVSLMKFYCKVVLVNYWFLCNSGFRRIVEPIPLDSKIKSTFLSKIGSTYGSQSNFNMCILKGVSH